MAAITVDGRLTADVELKYSDSGIARAKFTIAENHRRKDGNQWVDESTSFWDVTAWRGTAENLADLRKGQPVLVTGTAKIRDYERKDGSKGRAVEITASTVAVIPVSQHPDRQQQAAGGGQPADPWGTPAAAPSAGFTQEAPF